MYHHGNQLLYSALLINSTTYMMVDYRLRCHEITIIGYANAFIFSIFLFVDASTLKAEHIATISNWDIMQCIKMPSLILADLFLCFYLIAV